MKFVWSLLKFIWIISWTIVITLIMFLPITISALLSRTGHFTLSISNIWAWVLLKASFVSVKVIGKEKIRKGESYIIISNHQSFYDILALVTHLGIQFRWIIKKELLKVPLFGYALYASRNVFIDRTDRESSIASIRKGMALLPKGVSIIFFAEGTRSRDGRIGSFKKGGFVTALEGKRSILPVTVVGSRDIMPKGSLVFSPGEIRLVIADPIPTDDYSHDNVETLMEKTRCTIIENYRTT